MRYMPPSVSLRSRCRSSVNEKGAAPASASRPPARPGTCRRWGGGSIVQTSSVYGIRASDKRSYEGSHYLGRQISNPVVYLTSKAAVCGLTRQLAADWADAGIRVYTLVPAGVESGQNETFERRYANRVPLGRMARAEEMVGALTFLASDASSYVTGQEIVVDGGLSAW